MKKQIKLFFLLTSIPALSYAVNPISFGLETAINYADVGSVKSQVNGIGTGKLGIGYEFGSWLKLKLLTGSFLQTGLMYSKRKADYSLANGEKGEYSAEVIQIPLYYGRSFLKIISIGIGPSVAVPLSASYKTVTSTGTFKEKSNLSYTVSAAAFASVNLGKGGIFVRGQLPVLNNDKNTTNSGVTLSSGTKLISLGVFYKFI